ncbi:BTAD domain-containing putative transcriptional regulator [Leifsonia shinshuensis]|uniref:AfsR/SARP family transcriptional regulator n=1 Tax=Leifsonia shinshuensis TaxID=150026 RepID=UPI00285A2147|nr:BTAD domain-containing putative transcriptional regulator [Leifsonia shinshuensis]MDR6971176.1 putative ATPase/DNA-binding SARP family transcriptional activator [Leifsonia shinshuensis]
MQTAPPPPRVAVLGPVLVEDRRGTLTEPSGALGKSLIVALVLARGAASVPSLVEDLWDDRPPRQERAALQTLVSRVRTTSADGLLESTPGGYALAVAPEQTDLGRARAAADRATAALRAGDAAAAVAESTAALSLWRGQPGAELGATALADELQRTAAELRDDLLLIRARARRATGDHSGALADLHPLLEARPLDETLRLEQLRTLAAAGRRSEALLAFAELKEALLDRLGTRPGPELVALNAELLAADEDERPSAPRRVRIGLRSAPNALVGREYDLEAVEDLVATSRLTTILGPGGLGKTRLAQEVGNRAVHTPAVIVVELASVRSGEDVELAFASTLGIREARAVRPTDPGSQLDLRSRILGLLSERETLLIVDNCEHIVDAVAAYVQDILDSTSTVRVLATSRAPLAIGAERVYPLDSLKSTDGVGGKPAAGADGTGGKRAAGADGAGGKRAAGPNSAGADAARGSSATAADGYGPAVALFVERARAARPAAVLPLDVVARLCDRLDGLPLAIELAAARTRSLSVDEIERRLGNRFALLTGGERTAPERHRTLFAVIEWSWNLLGTSEQALLRRLSRFPDGFSAEAAEAVAGSRASTVLDDLDALVAQSLVTVTEDGSTGLLRYRMLETVREFGDNALVAAGEEDEVRDGMDAWAVAFCRDALSVMHGRQQVATFQRVTAEQDNLVTVLRSALEGGRRETVAAVFATLSYYWSLRSAHSEVIGFGGAVMDALARWEPEGEFREAAAACYTVLGGTFLFIDVRTSARAISGLRHLRRTKPFADSRLDAMAALVLNAGKVKEGLELLETYAVSPDPERATIGNLLLAQLRENSGELDAALASATRAWERANEAGDAWSLASAAQSIAQCHSQLAHPAEALEWGQRAYDQLAQLQADGDLRQLDWLIAMNAISSGDTARGRLLLERYLAAEPDRAGFDYADYYAIGYAGMAEIALAEDDPAEAVRLYDEALGAFGDAPTAAERTLNPWTIMLAAAALVARLHVIGTDPDVVDRDETDAAAVALRRRILVSARLNPPALDRPVIGSGMSGFSVWMLDARTAERHAASTSWVDDGLTLFALAGRANARQDVASLHRDALADRIDATWGRDRLAAATAAVETLSPADAVARGLRLLSDLRP